MSPNLGVRKYDEDSLHVLLDVPPALSDLEEDGRVAADDDDARHQEGQHHQKLLRRAPVLPAIMNLFSRL